MHAIAKPPDTNAIIINSFVFFCLYRCFDVIKALFILPTPNTKQASGNDIVDVVATTRSSPLQHQIDKLSLKINEEMTMN